jgi:hypothetical protein
MRKAPVIPPNMTPITAPRLIPVFFIVEGGAGAPVDEDILGIEGEVPDGEDIVVDFEVAVAVSRAKVREVHEPPLPQ